jgi:hypothetical protein
MKALVVIAHFFRAEAGGIYSSTDERRREDRRAALTETLLAWRAHFDESAVLNVGHRKKELGPAALDRLDLMVAVNGDDHLLDADLARDLRAGMARVALPDPRRLPFTAHQIMRDLRRDYDYFVYSEDDVCVRDPLLFRKIAAFQKRFGARRVLQPNRYEINAKALRPKTYVDGDLRFGLMKRLFALVEEREPELFMEGEAGSLRFTRALNPHAGFFALTGEQFEHWAAQPHFLDMDCSFISPLESAATLGLLKTFSIYKPSAPMGWFEVEHQDRKFSAMDLPVLIRGDIDENA